MTHTALIIDDEADIRELIALSLDRVGLDTHTAANLEEARHLLANYEFDVCLTDMRLPDGNGVEFVKYIQQVQPDLPVAVITAHGNMDAAVEAMKNGAFDFVSKPVDIGLLRSLVVQAIKVNDNGKPASALPVQSEAPNCDITVLSHKKSVPPALTDSQSQLSHSTVHQISNPTLAKLSGRDTREPEETVLIGAEKLIGRSQPMLALRSMIRKVARTNAPIWITGESGTGKELIAKLIHENGPRSKAPFVAINCGAIPSELMESEMFGHRKGSFTGAHSEHDGLFKRAQGGTLFLDEVAELPLHMQVKLLRAIQERTIRPVGSSEEVSTDVRILSASHKNLAEEVEQGRFRHDLYYRLNVICIKSPCLRDRSSDVPEIARYILKTIAATENVPSLPSLSADAEAKLSAYSFPGNVRELENILERAVALADGTTIGVDDLNVQLTRPISPSHTETREEITSDHDSREYRNIVEALERSRWNRKVAAEQLGMTYRQLRYRIKQYGIDQDLTGS